MRSRVHAFSGQLHRLHTEPYPEEYERHFAEDIRKAILCEDMEQARMRLNAQIALWFATLLFGSYIQSFRVGIVTRTLPAKHRATTELVGIQPFERN